MIDKTKNPKPYTYVADNDFEKMEEMARLAAEKAKAPTYTEKQYLETKQKAYDEGLEEGHRQALNNQEERIANGIERMLERLDTLISRQAAYEALQQKETVNLAYSIVKKIMPVFIEKEGQKEIERILNIALRNHTKITELTVYTHPDIKRDLSLRMDEVLKEYDFDTRMTFKDDNTLDLSDCRVEWGDGGIARIVPNLWEEIEYQISEYLDGNLPKNYMDDPSQQVKVEPEEIEAETEQTEKALEDKTDETKIET